MSYLTLDADRLVRDAVDAFLEGRLRPDPVPDTLYATKNSRYRILAGMVHEASDTSLMGAELVGWLVEEGTAPHIEPRWEFRARAIFVERKTKQVVVTSKVVARTLSSEARPPSPKPASIPPSPPVPSLKNGPSVAPPALVSLGGVDPKPGRPPLTSDEEITKVEYTSIADAHEMEQLRELSATPLDTDAPSGIGEAPASGVTKKSPPSEGDDDAVELSGPDIEIQEPVPFVRSSAESSDPSPARAALPPMNPPPRRR
jgi:hypothetical protein